MDLELWRTQLTLFVLLLLESADSQESLIVRYNQTRVFIFYLFFNFDSELWLAQSYKLFTKCNMIEWVYKSQKLSLSLNS